MKKVVMTLSALGLLVGSVMSYANTAANNTMATNPTANTNTMVTNPNTNTMVGSNSMVNGNTMTNGNTMVNGNNMPSSSTMTTTGTTTNSTIGNPQKPVAQWTCEDFLILDETVRPHAVAYGSGLNDRNKANDAVYDAKGTATVVPYLVEECVQNPKASFMDKVKNGWDRVKTDARNDVKR